MMTAVDQLMTFIFGYDDRFFRRCCYLRTTLYTYYLFLYFELYDVMQFERACL